MGDKQARPRKRVGHTVEPDEDDVDVSDCDLISGGVLLTSDGGTDEEDQHAAGAAMG